MTAADYSAANTAVDPDNVELEVPVAQAGMRLDAALARLMPAYSRSRIRAWIDAGRVSIAGVAAGATRKLSGGERVVVQPLRDARETAFVAEAIALSIVYDDASIAVLDKPAGLVVHPGSGNWHGTLANALLHRWPQLEGVPRAGIVHRLDKDTSGLLVVAKTVPAQTDLVRQLQAHTVHRAYLALAEGMVEGDGSVDAPIGRHPVKRTSMAVVARGKPARTHYFVRERFDRCTLVECRLETGRTHQIRVHFASIGHPLVGDPTYGRGKGIAFSRQALHAFELELSHPETRQQVRFESPLPTDFSMLLESLRRSS